jgi:hypothetical protein
MKTAKQFARELLKILILNEESDAPSLVVQVRDLCNRELATFPPSLVEQHVAEAQSVLESLGQPVSRLGALTLLALVQVGTAQAWSEAQRKSLRLHDILVWINTQYGVQYAENTRKSLRRDVIAPMVQAGILEHNPDEPNLPPNHSRNHYAIHASALEKIKQLGENLKM